jgi:hypothetical protein
LWAGDARVLTCLALFLSLVSVVYLAVGLYHLTLDRGVLGAIDLRSRWQEEHYVLRHKNFFVVRDRWDEALARAAPEAERDQDVEPDLGVPASPGYAPWTYFSGAAFMWPGNWTAARYYFAAVDMLALALVCLIVWHWGKRGGRLVSWLFCAAVLATFSVHSTLGVGQYGIIVFACLLGTLWLSEEDHPILAGLAMGVALAKPTLSVPFLIPLLVKRRWLTVMTALLYVGFSSCVTWWLTQTDPLTMLRQMVAASARWGPQTGVDIITFLYQQGVPVSLSLKLTAGLVLAVSCTLMVLGRHASLLTLFAVAAATARLWTYHRGYDDLIGIFLMVALGVMALERQSRVAMVAFFVMGVALWIPLRLLGTEVGFLALLVWIGCVAALLLAAQGRYFPAGALEPIPAAP